MHTRKMHMFNIHTNENKKEYILYIPKYYFSNKEIVLEDTSHILNNAKQYLHNYKSNGKIILIIISDELKNPSFPIIRPFNKKKYKFIPYKIFTLIN
jgi:hypothetical protein